MSTRYKIIGNTIEPIREIPSPALDMFCSGGDPIDWEQRRYEIAKNVLSGVAVNEIPGHYEQLAKIDVLYADALIAELKKGEKQ